MTKQDKLQYIKVRKEGGTTVLSLGKLIPKGWKIVKLDQVSAKPDESVTIRVKKVA